MEEEERGARARRPLSVPGGAVLTRAFATTTEDQ